MTLSQWVLFALSLQIIHFLGTWKLYIASGHKAWQAVIPVYNAVILMKIINRPKWWVFLLFIPTINLVMLGIIWVEILRSFGKNKMSDTFLVLLSFGLSIFSINYSKNPKYISDRSLKPKTRIGESVSSILFAIVAATIVHNYFIQPYIIPTGSLEKSLLIGDFLFVSKFHYGARAPMTAVSFPMVHDTIPGLKIRSYLKKPQLPYFRLPALQKIKRNDIVVFSWPADTVRQFFVKEKRVDKPIDKKSNYVKRCVGIPGDTLEIIDGLIHTNGTKNTYSSRTKIQFSHSAYAKKGVSSKKLLVEGFESFYRRYKIENITVSSYQQILPYIVNRTGNTPDNFVVMTESKGLPPRLIGELGLRVSELLEAKKNMTLTLKEAELLRNTSGIDSVIRRVTSIKVPNESFFPNKIPYDWNEDNFGPLLIPKKGMTVELNRSNLPLYKKIITDYESNELEMTPSDILINGTRSTSYTFKKDYYWMMGDNRQNSLDARSWGYVPFDHVVGKPVLIWFSINEGKIRWERLFTTVGGNGKPVSYLMYFLIALAGYIGYSFLRKNKKKVS